MNKKKETISEKDKDTMTESELLKTYLRVFPNQLVNSKGNRIGEIQQILKGKLPTDNISGVDYLLYNISKYANDKDRDSKDGKDFFPYFDTDKPVRIVKYKTKDQENIEKEEQEETYKEIEKLFDNLNILKKEFGELGEAKDTTKEMELFDNIKEEIEKKMDEVNKKEGISKYEKKEEKRKILTVYYKTIYNLLKGLNKEIISENEIIKKGGKKKKINKFHIKQSKKKKKQNKKNTIRKYNKKIQ
jgi:hypothetical protein